MRIDEETTLAKISPAAKPLLVTSANGHFATLFGKEKRALHRMELLGGEIGVSFDRSQGGTIYVSVTQPLAGKAFCTLEPEGMGESRWFSLETSLDLQSVKHAIHIIPILEAASQRNVSLTVVLRIEYGKNQFADSGATQIVVKRDPRSFSLPIDLSDLPAEALTQATSARLIFFIEARDVALDFFSLQTLAVSSSTETPMTLLERLRAMQGDPRLMHVAMGKSERVRERKLKWGNDISENFRIDIDSSQKQFANLTTSPVSNRIDFTQAVGTRWRTLELRFGKVENTGNLATLINFDARATGPAQRFGFFLRVYSEDWSTWEDKGDLGVITLTDSVIMQGQIMSLIFDKLPDNTRVNNIGILCFVPNECTGLDIKTLEAFIYDTRVRTH